MSVAPEMLVPSAPAERCVNTHHNEKPVPDRTGFCYRSLKQILLTHLNIGHIGCTSMMSETDKGYT